MQEQIRQYIEMWEQRCYFKGIPDEAPNEIKHLVPSYKHIALAILSNDLRKIGVTPKKSIYYDVLKKMELSERGVPVQLSLFI